ncbi:hypothetical protein HOY80DRAFT_965159 [Tuber brumale]|nr:hypothetical protein HOY80DRAFT_965159 [Tuber brumale]
MGKDGCGAGETNWVTWVDSRKGLFFSSLFLLFFLSISWLLSTSSVFITPPEGKVFFFCYSLLGISGLFLAFLLVFGKFWGFSFSLFSHSSFASWSFIALPFV